MEDALDILTGDQKEILVKLIDKQVEEKTKEVLEKQGVNADDLNLSDEEKFYRKDSTRLRKIAQIWENNGHLPNSSQKVTIRKLLEKDTLLTSQARQELSNIAKSMGLDNFSNDHPLLIPRVISEMARESIEPAAVLAPLLPVVSIERGTRIVFPAWGAMHAADIEEGQEYPERSLDLAGQVVSVTPTKVGIAIKVTEEMLSMSQYDVLGMHIRAAGRAMVRHKEKKVVNMMLNNGTSIIDNTSASVKSSTGRDGLGAYNGTLTLDDLFYCFAAMQDSGFTPDTLIMHPFAWQIFAQEPIARAFGFINGMNPLLWQMPKGSPGNAQQWRVGGVNQNTYVSSPGQVATTFTDVPSIFPTKFKIVVSPYLPYTAATKSTTIIMADSNEMGVIVQEESLMTDQWMDHARDITKIKFKERYAVASINNGLGIGLLTGIKIATSYDFRDSLSVTLSGLPDPLNGDDTNTGIV